MTHEQLEKLVRDMAARLYGADYLLNLDAEHEAEKKAEKPEPEKAETERKVK